MGNHRGLLQDRSGKTQGRICTCLRCLGKFKEVGLYFLLDTIRKQDQFLVAYLLL